MCFQSQASAQSCVFRGDLAPIHCGKTCCEHLSFFFSFPLTLAKIDPPPPAALSLSPLPRADVQPPCAAPPSPRAAGGERRSQAGVPAPSVAPAPQPGVQPRLPPRAAPKQQTQAFLPERLRIAERGACVGRRREAWQEGHRPIRQQKVAGVLMGRGFVLPTTQGGGPAAAAPGGPRRRPGRQRGPPQRTGWGRPRAKRRGPLFWTPKAIGGAAPLLPQAVP